MSEMVRHIPAEVEQFDPIHRDPTGGRLVAWAASLQAAHQIGSALCDTEFAPKHMRGKPTEAAAAILFGDEIGLTPTQALRSIYNIGGTPALYTRAMVALVLGAGHELWTEKDTPAEVTVCGRRKGSEKVTTVTWTTARAQAAGYTSNKKYVTDPQAMLYARAAGDVARRIAPDVLLGVAYNVEEMELAQAESTTVARGTTKTKRTTAKAIEALPEPEPDFEEPKRRLRTVEDLALPPPETEVGGDPDAPVSGVPVAAAPPTSDRPPGSITQPQMRMMMALLKQAGLNERDDRLDYCRTIIGREVESSADLTKGEAQQILDRLVALTQDGDPEPGFTDEPHPDEFPALPYKDD